MEKLTQPENFCVDCKFNKKKCTDFLKPCSCKHRLCLECAQKYGYQASGRKGLTEARTLLSKLFVCSIDWNQLGAFCLGIKDGPKDSLYYCIECGTDSKILKSEINNTIWCFSQLTGLLVQFPKWMEKTSLLNNAELSLNMPECKKAYRELVLFLENMNTDKSDIHLQVQLLIFFQNRYFQALKKYNIK